MNVQSQFAISADGVPIHYDVRGNGSIALMFVHGWCCDRHYWDRQVDHFPSYTVVTLDLAGHGESGRNRTRWTMPAFGQDVVAVVEQLGLGQVVLIGHSMGGAVIVEAARRLPTAVIGLVGVDIWHDLGHAQTPAQIAAFMAPFHDDFVEATRAVVRPMFLPSSDDALAEEIIQAVSAAPPQVGIGAAEQYLVYASVLQERLEEIAAPKIAINSADWPTTDMEAAGRCGIEVVLMSGVGHLVMMEDPQTFNCLLDEAVQEIIRRRTPQ